MQVATLFRESATLLGAASMIESPSSNSSSSLLSSSSLVSSTNSILGGGGGGGGGGNIGCSSGNITITTMDNCCGIDNGYFNHSNCQNNSNSLMVMANNCAASGNDDVPIKSELSPELSSMMPATTAIGEHDSTLNGNLTNFVCNPAENDNNKQHLIVDLPKQQVTCLIDHNHGYKLLSPTGKPEVHDDGYETSNGATPNRNNSNSVMMLRHEIPLPSDDPYNFIDDDNFTQYHHHHIHHHHRHHHHDPNEMGHIGEQTDLSPAAPLPPSSQPNNHQMQTNSQQQQQQQQQISNHHHINMQHQGTHNMSSHITNSPIPKKRGRKKKNGGGSGGSGANLSTFDGVNEINHNMGMIKSIVIKERKKHDRFNGMSEEEVTQRTLPDHLANNLDIIIIGINPGLFAAYKGHHYAGPGNHFWKCLYLSGLTRDQMTADDDYKLMDFGIGFTNMVSRPTKGSADLTRKEIKEGSRLLMEKLKKFRPKIAVFNGKLIYEVFSGKKDFNFGRQAGTVDGTNTYMWVMPSSSARCAQLPRAADKVPFYTALKKFRDYLNGIITELDETDIIVNEPIKYQNNNISNSNNSIENNSEFTMNNNNNNNSYNINVSPIKSELEEKSCCEIMNLDNNSSNSCLTDLSGSNINNNSSSNNNSNLINYNSNNQNMMTLNYSNYTMDGTTNHQLNNLLSNKKKRGRPKKDKTMTTLNEHNNTTTTFSDNTSNLLLIDSINKTIDSNPFNYNHHNIYNSSDIIKKKRGRPKKVKMNGNDNSSNSSNNPNMEYNNYSNQNFCIPQAENSPTLLEIGYNTNNNNNTNIINSSGENGNANNNSDTNNNSNNNDNSSSESKKCSGNTENGGTDVATKSLSGLESLVDQIPSITDDGRSSGGTTNPGSILDANDHQYNNNSKNNCLYTNNFTTSQQPSSTYLLPTNMPSPTSPQHHHHYNFIESPHIPVPVNPLYHHHHHHHHHPSLSYGQNYQTTYATGPPPPTLHMPSPNYPYGYTNASAYGHTSPQNTTYMNNHSHHHQHHNQSTNMFDRMSNANPIKSSVTELNGNFENF